MTDKKIKHWNGNTLCAIDVETTGLDPCWHEIVQICIMPLDIFYKPSRLVKPFYMNIRPDEPDRIDPEAVKVNKITDIINNGFSKDKAKLLFYEWVENKLQPGVTKWGNDKKIIPLAHNWPFDKGFLEQFFGGDFNAFFHPHYRDTMELALFLNDLSGEQGEKVPFPKVSLTYVCNQLSIKNECPHDALFDCIATAECYGRLLARAGVTVAS